MVEVAKKYQDALERIKKNVQEAYEYFTPNFKRWQEFQRFVFYSSLTDDDISVLKTLNKPQIEFNIQNAFISRLRGEFSKQEPSIEVSSDHDGNVDPQLIRTIEGYFRHLEAEARENGTAFKIYTDQLAGGFSWFKVWTEYANPTSMKQVIKFGRVFDPTLCFADPLAQEPHKADARYWGEIFPKTKEEFEEEYHDVDLSTLKYSKDIQGFNWSFRNEKKEIILLCDYYEKKTKKVKVVLLANNESMLMDDYKEMIEKWEQMGVVEQPPAIIKSRMSTIDIICRYRFIENQVIEYVETDFDKPNYIFVEGDSVTLRDTINSSIQQHCFPYVYHMKGLQRLKNFAGQTIANNIENQMQHKIIAPKEGIPVEYADAYTNLQQASTLVFNAFKDDDPTIPLPPPRELSVVPSPPENMQIFGALDQTAQMILGSYDSSLGINNNQLSGVAVVESATQSNAAAMPYIVNYMLSLNQVAQVILDLIPKYYTMPDNLPIIDKERKRGYMPVNGAGRINLKYNRNSLNIKVTAGVNFSIQKSKALQQIIGLMQASPLFAQFMNQHGLSVLLDNVEFRGIDQLKIMAEQFMKQLQMQQQAQAKAAMNQPNPLVIRNQLEMAKIKQKDQEMQTTAQLKAAEIAVSQQDQENERLRLLADIKEGEREQLVQMDKHQTEKARMAVDMAMQAAHMSHSHAMEKGELHRKVIDTALKHSKHESKESIATEKNEH